MSRWILRPGLELRKPGQLQVVLQAWQEPLLLCLWETVLQNLSEEQPWPELHQAGRARRLDLPLLRLPAPGQDQEPALGHWGTGERSQSAGKDKSAEDDKTSAVLYSH